MTIATNAEGIAICRCGSELHVVCSGGCPDPDVVFKSEIAAIPRPTGREPKKKPAKYPLPTHCFCGEPVAVRAPGRGRPPTKCEKHIVRKKVAA